MRLNIRHNDVPKLLAVGALVALLGFNATAAEKPSPEYVKAMKDLGAVAQVLTKAGATDDLPTVLKAAETAKVAFTVTLNYWKGTAANDAKTVADAGLKAASDIWVAANLNSPDGVEAATKEMMDTCRTCHTAHREKLDDGSFGIK